ncbi:MAG TPA: hypothetical protein VH413_05395 [Verrucomicrobiae bacterium]|jgi:hypothetical protein|nr:hypothetical protein [Verrucomicrobiae bacterium]
MVDYYKTIFVVAIPLVIIIAAPLVRLLLKQKRLEGRQVWDRVFKFRREKLDWFVVGLLLLIVGLNFVKLPFGFWLLMIALAPISLHFHFKRKIRRSFPK